MPTDERQLTLDVATHRELQGKRDHWLHGSLKIKGELVLPYDLNAGDELTVTVAGPDGEVITTARLECSYPAFKAIRLQGDVVGTERVTTAEVQA